MPRKFLSGLDLSGERLTSLGEPTSGTDAATKDYVDANAGGSSWRGTWNDVDTYDAGDIVSYGSVNHLWIAYDTVAANNPPELGGTGAWTKIDLLSGFVSWEVGVTYAVGSIVWYDNALWFSVDSPNIGNEPYYPIDPLGEDPIYWIPFGAPFSALGGGADGVGNSASSVEIVFREATFYDTDGPLTYFGALPAGHYYTLTESDLGKFVIVYRGYPTDTNDDPAATTVGVVAPANLGVVGDRVEVMVVESPDALIVSGSERISQTIIPSGLVTVDENDDWTSVSAADGDFVRPTQFDTKETIWYAATRGRFTKFIDGESDFGTLPAPIPIGIWLFEGAMIRGDAV